MSRRADNSGFSHLRIARQNRFQAGFTMTELMVVITIMAVLSAILLPALNKGKSRSQAISCLNNLRQLQLCWQMYSDEHGVLPANDYVNQVKLRALTLSEGDSWCPGNAITDTTTENIKQGLLFPYTKSTSIYRCPADSSRVEAATDSGMLRTRSYKMSSSINCSVLSGIPTYRKESEITDPEPSRLFVFIDSHENAVIDGHFTLYSEASGRKEWIDMPSGRHDQAGNLSFADGHIERWRWESRKDFGVWGQKITSVEDLNDMRKLQSAMRQK